MELTKMEKDLGISLREARENRRIPRSLLSEMSGVPEPTIRHIEDGTRIPSIIIARRIARALHINMEDLYFPPKEEPWMPEVNPDAF